MGWLEELCHNVGLMIHNIRHPDKDEKETRVIRKSTETEKRGAVTLRRTTIEEIEIQKGDEDQDNDSSI
ncbi:MAG: hypothetical protein ACYTGQ_02260 [Planctomycetota bacterium]|jgi:hypothetical protein